MCLYRQLQDNHYTFYLFSKELNCWIKNFFKGILKYPSVPLKFGLVQTYIFYFVACFLKHLIQTSCFVIFLRGTKFLNIFQKKSPQLYNILGTSTYTYPQTSQCKCKSSHALLYMVLVCMQNCLFIFKINWQIL